MILFVDKRGISLDNSIFWTVNRCHPFWRGGPIHYHGPSGQRCSIFQRLALAVSKATPTPFPFLFITYTVRAAGDGGWLLIRAVTVCQPVGADESHHGGRSKDPLTSTGPTGNPCWAAKKQERFWKRKPLGLKSSSTGPTKNRRNDKKPLGLFLINQSTKRTKKGKPLGLPENQILCRS